MSVRAIGQSLIFGIIIGWNLKMSAHVYANFDAIACKAGDDKVTAAFPDVCLIPTALVADRFGPLAAGDRGEPVGRRQEPVPGLAAGRDDRLVVGPDAQAELVLAQ